MKLREFLIRYKAIIFYLFFGACTTLVNVLVYYICAYCLGWANMTSTIIAWILAVLFAYVTNRRWVFGSEETTATGILEETCRFFGCRIATGIVDWLCMYIFVDVLSLEGVVVKTVSNILVIILNYLASKFLIFKMRYQKLDCLYSEIQDDPRRWLYYNDAKGYAGKFPRVEACLEDTEEAYGFIEGYFNLSGKIECLDDIRNAYLNAKPEIKNRLKHIVSAFFLGIKVAESFGVDIITKNENYFNFLYYWFLTCLYHDIGYVYESKNEDNAYESMMFEKKIRAIKENGFDGLKREFQVAYMWNPDNPFYERGIVELYLKGRAQNNKIEHGILGGILLYDRLRKRFRKIFNSDINRSCDWGKKEFYIVNEEGTENEIVLAYGLKDYKVYAQVADEIITHNIWRETLKDYMKDSEQYNDVTLIQINTENHRILFREDMPVGFILAIADSIEPLKYKKSLGSVMISQLNEPGKKGIELKIDNSCKKIIDNIKEFKDWVDVKVEPRAKCGSYSLFRIYRVVHN